MLRDNFPLDSSTVSALLSHPEHWAGWFLKEDGTSAKCCCCGMALAVFINRQIWGASVYSQFQHCCFLAIQVSQNQVDGAMENLFFVGKMFQ